MTTSDRGSRGREVIAARVRCVLFDLDGTLIDTIPLILSSFRHATATVLGEALPDAALLENVGMPLAKQMHQFAPDRADELLRVYREHNAAHHDEMALEYPGTHQTLDELKVRGLPLGVVTSKSALIAQRGLELFGLSSFFGTVVTADDVPVHKPDPFPLRRAAETLGFELAECAYVGDSPHDMAAAVSGGAVGIAALWGPFPRAKVLEPGPEYALPSIRDLTAVLDGRGETFRVGSDTIEGRKNGGDSGTHY